MKILETIDTKQVIDHLKRLSSGVGLDFPGIPCRPEEFISHRAVLESSDISRLVMWHEFREHTHNSSCRLVDTLESFHDKRIMSPKTGGVDLRHSKSLEPVIVTEDLGSDILYAVDGNHRLIAQYRYFQAIERVSVFVCENPAVIEWPAFRAALQKW